LLDENISCSFRDSKPYNGVCGRVWPPL